LKWYRSLKGHHSLGHLLSTMTVELEEVADGKTLSVAESGSTGPGTVLNQRAPRTHKAALLVYIMLFLLDLAVLIASSLLVENDSNHDVPEMIYVTSIVFASILLGFDLFILLVMIHTVRKAVIINQRPVNGHAIFLIILNALQIGAEIAAFSTFISFVNPPQITCSYWEIPGANNSSNSSSYSSEYCGDMIAYSGSQIIDGLTSSPPSFALFLIFMIRCGIVSLAAGLVASFFILFGLYKLFRIVFID